MADHYQTLGVEPDSDLTIIKRRYRLLVRENHPDAVEASRRQLAHERMLAINAAWTILSDPAERARYDRSRLPVVVPPSQSRANTDFGSSSNARPTARSSTSARTSARGGRSGRGAAARQGNPRTRLLTMVFEAAELYFFHGRAQEAIEICNRVMQFDARNAEAPALLGDIYAEQGRKDVAVLMYERAVRNQPDNALYRQKWEQLKTATASNSNNSAPRTAPPPSSPGGNSTFSTKGDGPRYGPNARRAKYDVSHRIAQNANATPNGAAQTASGTASNNATAGNATGANVNTSASEATPFARVVSATGVSATGVSATGVSATGVSATGVAATGANPVAGSAAHAATAATRAALEKPSLVGGLALAAVATALVVWGNTRLSHGAAIVTGPSATQLVLTSLAALGLGAALPLLNLVKGCGQVRRGAPAFTGWPFVFCMAVAGAICFPLAWLLYLAASMKWRLWQRSLLTVLIVALFLSAAMMAAAPPGQPSAATSQLLENALVWWSGRAILPSVLAGWAFGSLLRRR